MEVSAHLYEWLVDSNSYELQPAQDLPVLPDFLAKSFLDGHGLVPLVKRLAAVRHKNEVKQVPGFQALAKVVAPQDVSSKLKNWNILASVLKQLGVIVENDAKSLVVAGDTEQLEQVLNQMYVAEQQTHGPSDHTKASTKDGGVYLEVLNPGKSVAAADNCLEFLILSLSQHLGVTPKQAAALLTQSYHYLQQVVVHGVKGDRERVLRWFQCLYSHTQVLAALAHAEASQHSLAFVLDALKPGLLSPDRETNEWCLRVLAKLALDFTDCGLLEEYWTWFSEGDESAAKQSLNLLDTSSELILDLFTQFGSSYYLQLFGKLTQMHFPVLDNYLTLISTWTPLLAESEEALQELDESGLVDYWVSLTLAKEVSIQRKLDFATDLLWYFHPILSDETKQALTLLLAHICRDGGRVVKALGIGSLFALLDMLAEARSATAPILYKTLVLVYLENCSDVEINELLLKNFEQLISRIEAIPVSTLLTAVLQVAGSPSFDLTCAELDLFLEIARHPRLTVKDAVQCADRIGTFCITNLIYARATCTLFITLVSKFVDTPVMKEYLFLFCKYALNVVLGNMQELTYTRLKATVRQLNYQSALLIDLLTWILQQNEQDLNKTLAELIAESYCEYARTFQDPPEQLLGLYEIVGDPAILIEATRKSTAGTVQLIESNPSSQWLAIADLPKVRGKPMADALAGIQGAKKQFEDNQRKVNTDTLKQATALQRTHLKFQKQMQMRMIERGHVAAIFNEGEAQPSPEQLVLRHVSAEEAAPVQALLQKFYRAFRVLFNAFAGSGFGLKRAEVTDFEWLGQRRSRLNEAEYLRLLTNYEVVPALATKEEFNSVFKTCCQELHSDQVSVDFNGFKEVFCQLAYYIYSTPPYDCEHFPAMLLVQELLWFVRDATKAKGQSTELFDEPDNGPASKEQVLELNRDLHKSPNMQLPEGFKKVADYQVDVSYELPGTMPVSNAYKTAYELLDGIFFKQFQIRLIEPQIRVTKFYRAKGVVQKKAPPQMPPIYERTPPHKPQKAPEPPRPKSIKLSPYLQELLAKVPNEDKEVAQECAYTLDVLVRSVTLRMTRVASRHPEVVAEKFSVVQERIKAEQDKKYREEAAKRAKRQQILAEEIKKAKEQRKQHLEDLALMKKLEDDNKKVREQVQAERERKEREQRDKILKEWHDRRAREKGNSPVKPPESRAVLERKREAERKHKEQLDAKLKELQLRNAKNREAEQQVKGKFGVKRREQYLRPGGGYTNTSPKITVQQTSADHSMAEATLGDVTL